MRRKSQKQEKNRSTGQIEANIGPLKKLRESLEYKKMLRTEMSQELIPFDAPGGKQEDKNARKKRQGSRAEKKANKLPPYTDNNDDDIYLEKPLPFHTSTRFLKIREIRNGIIILNDGKGTRYAKLLELSASNILMRKAIDQVAVINSFSSYLRISPEHLHIKTVTFAPELDDYIKKLNLCERQEENENCRYLIRDRLDYIDGYMRTETLHHRLFLAFDCQVKDPDPEREFRLAAQQLTDWAETAKEYLSHCGNRVFDTQSPTQDTAEILYQLFNRNTSQAVPLSDQLNSVCEEYREMYGPNSISMIPIEDVIAPGEIEFRSKYYVMDGRYYKSIYIIQDSYPDSVPISWVIELVNLGYGIDVDFDLVREDLAKTRNRVRRKNKANQSFLVGARENDNTKERTKKLGAGTYIQESLSESNPLWYASIMITISANNKELLDRNYNLVRQFFRTRGLRVMTTYFNMAEAFCSSIPYNRFSRFIASKASQNVLNKDLAAWYPFSCYEFCDSNGIMLGIASASSSPFVIDPFNSKIFPNANIGIWGVTGSGKTYTMLTFATSFREQGIKTFVLLCEKPHEWLRVCKAIGGTFVSLGPQSNLSLNKYDIIPIDNTVNDLLDGGEIYSSRLKRKISMLKTDLCLRIPDVTSKELNAYDRACMMAYADYGITEDNRSLELPGQPGKYKQMPLVGDVQKHLRTMKDGERIADILDLEVHGSASIYNTPTNVDLDNKFIVFDLSGLDGDKELLPSTAFTVIQYIVGLMQADRTQKTVFMMDELWKMIGATASEKVATQILEIFKVIRGYGGSAIFATQDFTDTSNAIGKGVTNACSINVVLSMKMEQAKIAQGLFDLTDDECAQIATAPRGTALVCTGSTHVRVAIKASPLEHNLFTTDRSDLEKLYYQKLAAGE